MAVEKPLYNKIVGNLVRPWLEFFFFFKFTECIWEWNCHCSNMGCYY